MKILVVDDESLVRESLILHLKNMGFTDIIEADDGIKALDIVEHSAPDIILADIKMPGKDGLKLLSEIRSKSANIIYIIVSGYDLFDYAQTALKYGAFSYILKPVKFDELKDVMTKAVQCKQLNENMSITKIKAKQGMELLKKQFLLELLNENFLTSDYKNKKLNELNIKFEHSLFLIAIISIDNYAALTEKLSAQDKNLYKFSIENITTEVFAGLGGISLAFPFEEGQGFIFNFNETNPIYSLEVLQNALYEIKDNIKTFLNFTVTIGTSKYVNSIDYLRQAFEAAKKALNMRYLKGSDQVYILEKYNTEEESSFKTISYKTEQDFFSYFERFDHTSCLKIIGEVYSQFKNSKIVDFEALTKFNFQFILLIYKVMNKLNVNPYEVLKDELTLYNQVNKCTNIDEIINWFGEKLEYCILKVSSCKQSPNLHLINVAIEYIHSNYNKDISIESVAGYVHMSSSYFGKQFKLEIGKNFSDYLISYRISKAKEYLKEAVYRANEVSKMVGFNDEKYFYKTFKKYVGLTPGEYKATYCHANPVPPKDTEKQ